MNILEIITPPDLSFELLKCGVPQIGPFYWTDAFGAKNLSLAMRVGDSLMCLETPPEGEQPKRAVLNEIPKDSYFRAYTSAEVAKYLLVFTDSLPNFSYYDRSFQVKFSEDQLPLKSKSEVVLRARALNFILKSDPRKVDAIVYLEQNPKATGEELQQVLKLLKEQPHARA